MKIGENEIDNKVFGKSPEKFSFTLFSTPMLFIKWKLFICCMKLHACKYLCSTIHPYISYIAFYPNKIVKWRKRTASFIFVALE
jgi:hypothetical protein